MPDLNQFRKADGHIDWPAYNQAKVNAGEECRKCGAYIMSFLSLNHVAAPRLCGDCKELESEAGEVTHDKYIRCPKCAHQFDPYDCEMYRVLEDGTHEVSCQECDHEFEMQTRVSYSFVSPERISGEPSESED